MTSSKMSRKRNNTAFNMLQFIIFHQKKGRTYRETDAMLHISKNIVADIIQRFYFEDCIEYIPQTGRLSLLNTKEKNRIIQKGKKIRK